MLLLQLLSFFALCTLSPAVDCSWCYLLEPKKNRTLVHCSIQRSGCFSCISFNTEYGSTLKDCVGFPVRIQAIQSTDRKLQLCQETNVYWEDKTATKNKVCTCFTDGCNKDDIEFQPKVAVYKPPVKCYSDYGRKITIERNCRTCTSLIMKDGSVKEVSCYEMLEMPLSSHPNNCVRVKHEDKEGCLCGCFTDYCNKIRSKEENKKMCGFDNFGSLTNIGSLQRRSVPVEILVVLSALWLFAA